MGGVATRRSSLKDPTVLAVPVYFASMFLEARSLRRRRTEVAFDAGQYERRDTVASLTMGAISLAVPLVAPRLMRPLTPGKGRGAKWVLAGAAVGAVLTTAADTAARSRRRRSAHPDADAGTARLERAAGIGGVVTVALGGLGLVAWWPTIFDAERFYRRRIVADLGTGPVALGTAIVAWDFIYYWNHRFMHTARYMWAMHVVHHSSEHYNLSTALRQPVAEPLTTFVPYGVVSMLGVRPDVMTTARGLNLLWQYWIHTEAVRSLGSSEAVLNSPSHHRVHHGSNPRYLDKNHGSILIVWDRLFGTYEPETEPVVYGLTKNISTFNPVVIASHEYVAMARDVASARGWRDRVGFVVRGPGWATRRRAELAGASLS